MSVHKQWNQFEAAILLDNYIKYINGKISRKEAIQKTSLELRSMAQRLGYEIDDIYRNIKGITFQMYSMESAYKGYTLLKPASKLFAEMVQIYKQDKGRFIKILKEVRRMLMTETKQNNFVEWLSQKNSPVLLSELLLAYKKIDEFCIDKKILECSLLEIIDLDVIKKVQYEIEHNRIFRFNNRIQMNKILEALRIYISYVVGLPNIKTKENKQFRVEETLPNNDHNLNENEKKCVIDFSNIVDLSYTKPTKAFYFEDDIGKVSSWKELYVKVFQNLYEDYDYKIPKNKPFNLENGRMDFCTQEYYPSMASPKEIERGVYLETNLSATDIVRKIKLILDICLVDEENIVIEFERNDNIQPESERVNRIRINSNADDFFDWLKNEQCMAIPTCRSYVSAVNTAERFTIDNGFEHNELYTDDYYQAKETVEELFNDKIFIEYNAQQHNRFKSALNKLLMYIGDDGDTASGEKNSINLEPYINILLEKFPRGYRMGSSLELKKFKRYWENLYGTGIDIKDDEVLKHIECCGVKYEEKIYMPQKMLDDNIKTKLFSYINNCFLTEKTTIYFEALFKEFSDDFLDYCMYNGNMLRAYLNYMNDGCYFISENYISKDANVTTDPYDEIKECLIQ